MGKNDRGFFKSENSLCVALFILSLCLSPKSAQDSVTIKLLVPPDSSTSPDTRPTNNPFIAHDRDTSIPLPTRFAWSVQRSDTGFLTFDVSLSEESGFDTNDLVARNYNDTSLAVWNLKINTPYYWKISARDSANDVWNSPVFSFRTPDAWPRMIYIDGTTNVRDIGGRLNMDGVMIRQGLFYRSAEINQNYNITTLGLAQLMSLGVVCDIDLRNKDENAHLSLPVTVRYFHPITDSGVEILSYANGLANTRSLYRDVFKELAKSDNYPVLCHCLAGADRAGTVAALLEALLACSDQQIGEDYVWTSLSINGVRDTMSTDWQGTIAYIKSFDKQNATVQAGAWYFLQSVGVTVQELIEIRKILIGDEHQPYPELGIGFQAFSSSPGLQRTNRKYFLLSSLHNAIVIRKGVTRAVLYDLSGKKIWDFTRKKADADVRIQAPVSAAGVHVFHISNE